MADFMVPFESIGSGAGSVEKTILQMTAGSLYKRRLKELLISGNATTDVPILVRIRRQTSAGTPGGDSAAITPNQSDSTDTTPANFTALKGPSAAAWTVEPGVGDLLAEFYINGRVGCAFPWSGANLFEGGLCFDGAGAGGHDRIAVSVVSSTNVTLAGHATIGV